MLKQRIKGLNPLTISVKSSEADQTALQGILAGEVEVYDLKAEGGTAMPTMPEILNRKNFIVGANTPTGRITTYLQIPHVKVSADYNSISSSIIGKFNASYDSSVKADFCNMKFDA